MPGWGWASVANNGRSRILVADADRISSVGTDIIGTVPHIPQFFFRSSPYSILLAHKYGSSLRGTGKKYVGTNILTHFNF